MKHLTTFIRQSDGTTAVEYAVMLALIIVVCIASITLVGGETFNFWNNNQSQLDRAFGGEL